MREIKPNVINGIGEIWLMEIMAEITGLKLK